MIEALLQNHTNAEPSNDTMMLHGSFSHINNVIFDGVNANLERECAIRTKSSGD